MKIKDLSAVELTAILDKVEKALETSATKAMVVRTLSDNSLCSAKSTGTEKTLLAAAQGIKYVPAKFALLMGVKAQRPNEANPEPVASTPSSAAMPKPPVLVTPLKTASPADLKSKTFLNPKSLAWLKYSDTAAEFHFNDGSAGSSTGFSESALRSRSKIIEFAV